MNHHIVYSKNSTLFSTLFLSLFLILRFFNGSCYFNTNIGTLYDMGLLRAHSIQ